MALLTSSKATIGMLRRLIVYNKMFKLLVFSFYSLFSPFFVSFFIAFPSFFCLAFIALPSSPSFCTFVLSLFFSFYGFHL
jgi:hypothetical protein